MENASKALIMAGGMLIALIIISILVVLFGNIGDVYYEQGESLTVEQLEEYNRKFAVYNNTKGLYGSELLSLANLADEYNAKLLDSVGGDKKNQFYTNNELKIDVDIYQILVDDEIKDEFGNVVKKIFKSNGLKGKYDIKEIKEYNDELIGLSMTNPDAKSALTELRSLPFTCVPDMTSINNYGIITYMYFNQEIDQNILNSIR